MPDATEAQPPQDIIAAFARRERAWKSFRRQAQPPAWLTVTWGVSFVLCSTIIPWWMIEYHTDSTWPVWLCLIGVQTVISSYFWRVWTQRREQTLLKILREEAPAVYDRVKREKIA